MKPILHALCWLLPVSMAAAQTMQVEAPPAQPTSDRILQDGTPVKLQLTKTLSSADAKAGQEIFFEVVDDIDIAGVTVLHRGARAIGVVTEAEAKKRMGRAGKLNFTIASVRLADDEKAALRAVNDAKGESRVAGMTALMVGVVPMAAAPFLLLIKGGDFSIPEGTQITAFIDGDVHLDLKRFADPAVPVSQTPVTVESTPDGADIEVDGAFVGNTPFTISVTLGDHRISVRKKGFAHWGRTVTVASGAVRLSAVLEEKPQQ